MSRSTAVTLADVAQRAGVSKVAASAVVNGARTSARISEATRERVLAAAKELQYHPNVAARSLVHPGMNMLGVTFSRAGHKFIDNMFVASILEGIMGAATDADFNVALFPKPWIDTQHSAAPFRDRRTDGLIVIAPHQDSDMVPGLAELGLPLVVVGTPSDEWSVPSVDVDNLLGSRLAAQHLLSLGHRRIGYVAGRLETSSASSAVRRTGFLAALSEAGVPVPDERIVRGDYNYSGGYQAAYALLKRPEPPTALFCANDFSAQGALQAARDLNIAVPEQLSVVGFDDISAAAQFVPPLTTVLSPLEAMGKQAAELLITHIKGEEVAPVTYWHMPTLVIRRSTSPL